MGALFARLERAGSGVASAVRIGSQRFIVATVAIVLFAIVANLQAGEARVLDGDDATRLLSALHAAGLASVAARLFLESRERASATALRAGPAAAALLAGLCVLLARPFGLFTGAVTSALLVLVPLAPFIGRGTPRRFWDFTVWTVLGSTLALSGVVLFLAGLFALISLIGTVFGQAIGNRVYVHLSVTALALVGPLVALGRIPPVDREASFLDGHLSTFVRPLFQWIAAPFVLVLALVLHLYAARALLQGGLGHAEIGWIAAFYLVLAYAVRLGIEPYRNEGSAVIAFVARWWAAVSLVPLLLLWLAAYERIAAEGVTLPRYYLALLCGAMAAAIALQGLGRVRNDIRWLAGLLPAALLLSAQGPLGAPATVARSQSALIEAELGPGETLAERLSVADERQLNSRLRALESVGAMGERARFELHPNAPTGTPGRVRAGAIEEVTQREPFRHRYYRTSTPVPTDGFDRIEVQVSTSRDGPGEADPRIPRWTGTRLVFAGEATVDLDDFLTGERVAAENAPAGDSPRSVSPVLDVETDDGRTLRLFVWSLAFDQTGLPIGGTLSVLYRADEFPEGLFGGD